MTPMHHADEAILIDYAAGSLREPVALLVATHLALCPVCRAEVRRLESLGGALFDELEPAAVGAECLDEVMARLDEPEPAAATMAPQASAAPGDKIVPRPLRDYLPASLDEVFAGSGRRRLAEVPLLASYPGYRTRLMRIRAGATMPKHTHGGSELTLVLSGGFSDHTGHYLRGDLAATDPSITHQPVADDDGDCVCLAVTDAPLKLVGPLGMLLNPFLHL